MILTTLAIVLMAMAQDRDQGRPSEAWTAGLTAGLLVLILAWLEFAASSLAAWSRRE